MKKTQYNLRILDYVKGYYDDKSFFTSKEFYKRLHAIMIMVTNWYRKSKNYFALSLKLLWEPENPMTACTDNNTVIVNMANSLLEGLSKTERCLAIWGLFAHELGHCLHTDFQMAIEFFKGKWDYKTHMSKETYAFFESHKIISLNILKEIQNILEDPFIEFMITSVYTGSFKKGINFIKGILQKRLVEKTSSGEYDFMTLLLAQARECLPDEITDQYECLKKTQNIFEKLYIDPTPTMEDRLNMTLEIFDAIFDTFIKDAFEDKTDEEIQKQMEQMQQRNADTNTSKNENQHSGGMAVPQKSNSSSSSSSEDSKHNQNGSSTESSNQNKEKTDTDERTTGEENDTSTSSESNREEADNNADNSQTNSGGADEENLQNDGTDENGSEGHSSEESSAESSDGINGDGETNDGDEENPIEDSTSESIDKNKTENDLPKEPQDESSGDSDTSTSEKDATFSKEGANPKMSNNRTNKFPETEGKEIDSEIDENDFEPINICDDINSVIESVAKSLVDDEKVQDEFNDFEINREISSTDWHRWVNYTITRIKNGSKEIYKSSCEEANVSKISKTAQNKVRDAVLQKKRSSTNRRQTRGSRLDINAFCKRRKDEDLNVFMNSSKPSKQPLMAVSAILDHSGSMSGNKIKFGMIASMILEDFCRNLQIPFSLITHTEEYGHVKIHEYMRFDGDKNERYALSKIPSDTAMFWRNRDGFAIRYSLKNIKYRKEPFKVIIIISDGLPNGQGYTFGDAKEDIADIKKICKKNNIQLLAFVIDGDIDRLAELYGKDNLVDCRDLEKFPKEISRVLAEKSKEVYK